MVMIGLKILILVSSYLVDFRVAFYHDCVVND